MEIKPIKTKADHRAALRAVEGLSGVSLFVHDDNEEV